MRILFFLAALAGLVYFGVSFYNQRKLEVSLAVPSGYSPAEKVVEPTWQEKVAAAAKAAALAAEMEKKNSNWDTSKPLLPMASLEPKSNTSIKVIAPRQSSLDKSGPNSTKRAVSDISRHRVIHKRAHSKKNKHNQLVKV